MRSTVSGRMRDEGPGPERGGLATSREVPSRPLSPGRAAAGEGHGSAEGDGDARTTNLSHAYKSDDPRPAPRAALSRRERGRRGASYRPFRSGGESHAARGLPQTLRGGRSRAVRARIGQRRGSTRTAAIDDGGVEKAIAAATASWRSGMATGTAGTSAAGALDRHLGPLQGAPGKVQFVPPASAISRIWSDAEARNVPATGAGWEQPAAVADGAADAQTTSQASRGVSRTIGRNARGIVMGWGRFGIARGPPSWREHELR